MSQRNFMTTINFDQDANPYKQLPIWANIPHLKRASGQLETCPTTGRTHWQIFLEMDSKVRPSSLRGYGMHISADHKDKHPNAGRNYVRKQTLFPESRFDWPEEEDMYEFNRERLRIELFKKHKDLWPNCQNSKEEFMEALKNSIEIDRAFLRGDPDHPKIIKKENVSNEVKIKII